MKDVNQFGRRKDVIIYANRASASAGLLGRSLACRRWLVERPRLGGGTVAPNRQVVNWGTTQPPTWLHPRASVLNNFPGVLRAISKVESYRAFAAAGVPTLEFTTDVAEASGWNSGDEGCRVLARRDGLSSGRGITVFERNELAQGRNEGRDRNVDFFAKYFAKTHEYRVHVFNPQALAGKGERTVVEDSVAGRQDGASVHARGVIDITQKKRVREAGLGSVDGESDNRTVLEKVVRSHDNGWIHAHEDLHLPAEARLQICDAAQRAVAALGLDFGAVDILARYSKKEPTTLRTLAVCEVNTAPGLENTVTIEAWKNAFSNYLGLNP